MTDYRPTFPQVKLQRPYANARLIVRPRLLKKLNQVREKPVALISAPAGFGKTTLLAQWLDRCSLPNAWLQLDENDRDLPAFLFGVVSALRQLFPGCLQKTADLLLAQGPVPLDVWKSTLIYDLELLESAPFILALDDYHLVGNPAIDLLLADVQSYATLPLRLILSARRSPSLSFSRLRVQGRIVEIPTAELRFTDKEAAMYFQHIFRVPLDGSAINLLQSKTEGWATGLTLLAVSLKEAGRPDEIIANLSGLDRQVSNYLLDQVFNNQPDEIQQFLLKTATFSQFCAAYLAEAFGFEQSEGEIQALLERIEATQLFITPLDTSHSWFRYHPLFRQLLLSRQPLYLDPAEIAQHRRRAAAWLARHGQADEALSHLIAVQDWVGAAQQVESQLRDLLNAEDFQGLKRRLSYFPADVIAARPGLLLIQAWMAHFGLRHKLTHSLIAQIQVMLDAAQPHAHPESGAPAPGFEIIPHAIVQAQVWELDGMYYYLINQDSRAAPIVRQALEILPESWLFARGNAMIYQGMVTFMAGQYDQVVATLSQAYERLLDPSTTYGARLLFTLGVVHLLHGELERCRQTAEHLTQSARNNNLLLMQGWGNYLLARVYHEWNQLELAASYYKLVVDQRFTANLFCSLESIAGYIFVLQTQGCRAQAQESMQLLQAFYSEQISAAPAPVAYMSAWLNLQNDNRDEARRWADSFITPIAEQSMGWYHIPHLYKAMILVDASVQSTGVQSTGVQATGAPDAGGDTGRLLAEIQELAERTHNNFTLVRVLAMQAVWLARQGDNARALQTLERALALARPGWFIHSFVGQGAEMLQLLKTIAPALQKNAGLAEYVAALIDAFPLPAHIPAAPSKRTVTQTLLTNRELEVLELLAQRLSIKEISARLYISPSTVQKHNHHIYHKLNVANKRQAVARADELGILKPRD